MIIYVKVTKHQRSIYASIDQQNILEILTIFSANPVILYVKAVLDRVRIVRIVTKDAGLVMI